MSQSTKVNFANYGWNILGIVRNRASHIEVLGWKSASIDFQVLKFVADKVILEVEHDSGFDKIFPIELTVRSWSLEYSTPFTQLLKKQFKIVKFNPILSEKLLLTESILDWVNNTLTQASLKTVFRTICKQPSILAGLKSAIVRFIFTRTRSRPYRNFRRTILCPIEKRKFAWKWGFLNLQYYQRKITNFVHWGLKIVRDVTIMRSLRLRARQVGFMSETVFFHKEAHNQLFLHVLYSNFSKCR